MDEPEQVPGDGARAVGVPAVVGGEQLARNEVGRRFSEVTCSGEEAWRVDAVSSARWSDAVTAVASASLHGARVGTRYSKSSSARHAAHEGRTATGGRSRPCSRKAVRAALPHLDLPHWPSRSPASASLTCSLPHVARPWSVFRALRLGYSWRSSHGPRASGPKCAQGSWPTRSNTSRGLSPAAQSTGMPLLP